METRRTPAFVPPAVLQQVFWEPAAQQYDTSISEIDPLCMHAWVHFLLCLILRKILCVRFWMTSSVCLPNVEFLFPSRQVDIIHITHIWMYVVQKQVFKWERSNALLNTFCHAYMHCKKYLHVCTAVFSHQKWWRCNSHHDKVVDQPAATFWRVGDGGGWHGGLATRRDGWCSSDNKLVVVSYLY